MYDAATIVLKQINTSICCILIIYTNYPVKYISCQCVYWIWMRTLWVKVWNQLYCSYYVDVPNHRFCLGFHLGVAAIFNPYKVRWIAYYGTQSNKGLTSRHKQYDVYNVQLLHHHLAIIYYQSCNFFTIVLPLILRCDWTTYLVGRLGNFTCIAQMEWKPKKYKKQIIY